jgi:hypothetical protein
MSELLDVVTRAYEYRRAQTAPLVGTMSGLETAQLARDGKLPTPPIIATLGSSLVEVAEGHAASRVRRPSGNTISSQPCMEDGSPRCSTQRSGMRSSP